VKKLLLDATAFSPCRGDGLPALRLMPVFEREGPSFACYLGTAPLSIAPSTCRTIVDRCANDDPLKPARGRRATLDKVALISRAELEGASRPAMYLRTAHPMQPVGPDSAA
jgi:hypothetical protein